MQFSKTTNKIFIISIITNIMCSPLIAQTSFYSEQAQGWFWYKSDPKEIEKKKKTVPMPINTTASKQAQPQKITPNSPTPLSSAWLRKNLPKYLDAAQDNPTLDNVKTYFYLQRIAMDKANRFSDMAQLAVVGNPNLDELSRRPTATFASQEIDKETKKRREHILNLLKKQVGIFSFSAQPALIVKLNQKSLR